MPRYTITGSTYNGDVLVDNKNVMFVSSIVLGGDCCNKGQHYYSMLKFISLIHSLGFLKDLTDILFKCVKDVQCRWAILWEYVYSAYTELKCNCFSCRIWEFYSGIMQSRE